MQSYHSECQVIEHTVVGCCELLYSAKRTVITLFAASKLHEIAMLRRQYRISNKPLKSANVALFTVL